MAEDEGSDGRSERSPARRSGVTHLPGPARSDLTAPPANHGARGRKAARHWPLLSDTLGGDRLMAVNVIRCSSCYALAGQLDGGDILDIKSI